MNINRIGVSGPGGVRTNKIYTPPVPLCRKKGVQFLDVHILGIHFFIFYYDGTPYCPWHKYKPFWVGGDLELLPGMIHTDRWTNQNLQGQSGYIFHIFFSKFFDNHSKKKCNPIETYRLDAALPHRVHCVYNVFDVLG
jgi:hypothetical protein